MLFNVQARSAREHNVSTYETGRKFSRRSGNNNPAVTFWFGLISDREEYFYSSRCLAMGEQHERVIAEDRKKFPIPNGYG